MSQFSKVEEIHFWCQKILPLVFDDSLSYYETLCKIQAVVNELVKNNNNIPDYLESLVVEYITGPSFAETLSKVLAKYNEVEECIELGYSGQPIQDCEHVYLPEFETIKVVGK